MFFLVSGAAASGKSTLAKNLVGQIENLVCHDADERKAEDADMRCQQLEEWVQLALGHQEEGCDFLLTSHSPLGELLACPSAVQLTSISAALLDCHDNRRIQRMRDRGVDPRWPPSQHVLNWASWQRMHAWDPQWEADVVIGNGGAAHLYGRWSAWGQGDGRWQVRVIDTTSSATDIKTVQKVVTTWVRSEREKKGTLTLAGRWWEEWAVKSDEQAADSSPIDVGEEVRALGLDTYAAQRWAGGGRIEAWVHTYLLSGLGGSSNAAFSQGLKREKRWWLGPLEVDLGALSPAVGTDPELEYVVDEAYWLARTTAYAQSFSDDRLALPPLIVEYRDGELSLRDGNTRYGAMRLLGWQSCWVVIWYNSEQDYGQHLGEISA